MHEHEKSAPNKSETGSVPAQEHAVELGAQRQSQTLKSPPSPEGGRAFRQQVIEEIEDAVVNHCNLGDVAQEIREDIGFASARFALQQAREQIEAMRPVGVYQSVLDVGRDGALEDAVSTLDSLFAQLESPAVPVREQQEQIENDQGASDHTDTRQVRGQLPYERFRSGKALFDAIALQEGEHLLSRHAFRWHLDGQVIPNCYEMFERDGIVRERGWEIIHTFGPHIAVVRRAIAEKDSTEVSSSTAASSAQKIQESSS